jgi:hypothetical protein
MLELMKKIFNVIKNVLTKLWGNMLAFLVERGEVAVKVTNIIKEIVENPAINYIVALTPTSKDDVILAKAKALIPKVAFQVGLAMNMIKAVDASENELEAAARVIDYVRLHINEDGKGIFYREFAGKLAEYLSDGHLSTAEAVALAQLIFKRIL